MGSYCAKGLMSGVLYFDDPMPAVGAKLLIIVDSVNRPTGAWDGKLVAVKGDSDVAYLHPYHLPTTRWVVCNAIITDSQAPRESVGYEPSVSYTAYIATTSSQYFRQRLFAANAEIRGLKRRMEIEKAVWHDMIRAVVEPHNLLRLEKLLGDFLTELGNLK